MTAIVNGVTFQKTYYNLQRCESLKSHMIIIIRLEIYCERNAPLKLRGTREWECRVWIQAGMEKKKNKQKTRRLARIWGSKHGTSVSAVERHWATLSKEIQGLLSNEYVELTGTETKRITHLCTGTRTVELNSNQNIYTLSETSYRSTAQHTSKMEKRCD